MTAVVGILNKNGIAIAADSAMTVTTGQGRKVYNSAHKIFALSKYHPVGVAIYNSAHFMGIPWEGILKEYRRQLGEQCFDALHDYQEDFIAWMQGFDFFSKERNENDVLAELGSLVDYACGHASTISKEVFRANINSLQEDLEAEQTILKLSGENRAYVLSFLNRERIRTLLSKRLKQEVENTIVEKLVTLFLSYLEKEWFLKYTGLVFVGYGDKEMFPRLASLHVSIALGTQLRYLRETEVEIDHNTDSAVMPFAQQDVIETILTGISPDVLKASQQVFRGSLENILNKIAEELPGLSEEQQQVIQSMAKDSADDVQHFYKELNDQTWQTQTLPMLKAVAQLNKEDLAEMAETLIHITYLKRRFTMKEESVGGPVDVVLITKGDGLVWVKRKNYFDADLNR